MHIEHFKACINNANVVVVLLTLAKVNQQLNIQTKH